MPKHCATARCAWFMRAGFFRDGLAFNMPESDPLPAPAQHCRIVSAHPRKPDRAPGDSAATGSGAPNARLTDQDQNGSTRFIAEPD